MPQHSHCAMQCASTVHHGGIRPTRTKSQARPTARRQKRKEKKATDRDARPCCLCSHAESNSGQLRFGYDPQRTVITTYTIRAVWPGLLGRAAARPGVRVCWREEGDQTRGDGDGERCNVRPSASTPTAESCQPEVVTRRSNTVLHLRSVGIEGKSVIQLVQSPLTRRSSSNRRVAHAPRFVGRFRVAPAYEVYWTEVEV
jgi:hypothetical protein